MKNDKNLIELFRENEHKLHEFPSNNAWQRLEQRLDAHRRKTRIASLRPLAMAASLVLLVGMIALLTWVFDTMKQERTRGYAQFVQLEDLPPASGPDLYAQNLSLRDQYGAGQLEEGEDYKSFRVNRPKQTPPPAQPAATEQKALSLETPKAKRAIEYTPTVADNEDVSLKPAPAPPAEKKEKAAATEEKPFQWLVGTWQSEGQYPEVFEEWTSLDENRLKGVAYIVDGGKRQVLEELEIRNVDGVWTYFTSTGGQVLEPPYELDTILSNQAIFSNATKGPEQQIILERTGAEEFSSNRNYQQADDYKAKQQAAVRNMKKIN